MGKSLPMLADTEQYRISQYTTSTANPEQILVANPYRWSVQFFCENIGFRVFPDGNVLKLANTGWSISAGQFTPLIKYPDYLSMVGAIWWVRGNFGGELVTIIETFVKER